VGLSVDDFGTGYSSLSLLSTLPINSLKIDRSFVDRLDGISVESEIVRAVIQLGLALGKRVIAEGIETQTQLERLQALGCHCAQGYLLARPMTVAQVESLLSAGSANPGFNATAARAEAAVRTPSPLLTHRHLPGADPAVPAVAARN
ncbi:MAG: EAL domain-containing protein, partial [Pseudomonadota bacterium]|nr:EAL domain-containing protein [Pseudomonadota bacterium]